MDQQTAWNREYQQAQGVPTSTRSRPSSAVTRLLAYVKRHRPLLGNRVLDLGCGAGRNAFYVARQGYDVTAVDFSTAALEKLRAQAKNSPVTQRLTTRQADLTKPLPFADNSFDLALDIVTTMTLTPVQLPHLVRELQRVLRPGGLFLSYVLSDDDGFLAATNPGNLSTTVEVSGITDYYFSEASLRRAYRGWNILALDKIVKNDTFYGKRYTRRIWWMLLENPAE